MDLVAKWNGSGNPDTATHPSPPHSEGRTVAKKLAADDVAGVWEIVRNAVYFVRNAGTLGLAFCVLYVVREQLQSIGPPLMQAVVTATETNKILAPLLKERVESSAELKASLDNLIIVNMEIRDEMKAQRKDRK